MLLHQAGFGFEKWFGISAVTAEFARSSRPISGSSSRGGRRARYPNPATIAGEAQSVTRSTKPVSAVSTTTG